MAASRDKKKEPGHSVGLAAQASDSATVDSQVVDLLVLYQYIVDSSTVDSLTLDSNLAEQVLDSLAVNSGMAVAQRADLLVSYFRFAAQAAHLLVQDLQVLAAWKPVQESAYFAELLAERFAESLEDVALELLAVVVQSAFAALPALSSSAWRQFAVGLSMKYLFVEKLAHLSAFLLLDSPEIAGEQAEEASDKTMSALKPTDCLHLRLPIPEFQNSKEPRHDACPEHTLEDWEGQESVECLARSQFSFQHAPLDDTERIESIRKVWLLKWVEQQRVHSDIALNEQPLKQKEQQSDRIHKEHRQEDHIVDPDSKKSMMDMDTQKYEKSFASQIDRGYFHIPWQDPSFYTSLIVSTEQSVFQNHNFPSVFPFMESSLVEENKQLKKRVTELEAQVKSLQETLGKYKESCRFQV